MSNPISNMVNSLRIASLKPGEAEGAVTVTFESQLRVEVNVPEDTVSKIDEPEIAESTRVAAANKVISQVYGPTAIGLIELRDLLPKKYQPKVNKLLAHLISGGGNG